MQPWSFRTPEMVLARGVTSTQDQAELYILDPTWKPPPQPTPVMTATLVTTLGTLVTQAQQDLQQLTVPVTTGTPILPGPHSWSPSPLELLLVCRRGCLLLQLPHRARPS